MPRPSTPRKPSSATGRHGGSAGGPVTDRTNLPARRPTITATPDAIERRRRLAPRHQTDVDWITNGTESGRQANAAVPPPESAYATLTNHPHEPHLSRDPAMERR